MTSEDFAYALVSLLDNLDPDVDDLASVRDVVTFRDAGVLTYNDGLVVTLDDGTEFQVQIVRSK